MNRYAMGGFPMGPPRGKVHKTRTALVLFRSSNVFYKVIIYNTLLTSRTHLIGGGKLISARDILNVRLEHFSSNYRAWCLRNYSWNGPSVSRADIGLT
jgi:hypothetical protein